MTRSSEQATDRPTSHVVYTTVVRILSSGDRKRPYSLKSALKEGGLNLEVALQIVSENCVVYVQ